MTGETKHHDAGICLFCKLHVTRAYPESLWKDPLGRWRCEKNPASERHPLAGHVRT